MKSNELFLSSCIFSSDDDSPIVEDIYVGYDKSLNLIVLIEYTDYDEPEYNCATYAIIKKDEAFELAKRLRIAMTELPSVISTSMDEYAGIVNPTLSQTEACFRDVLDYLVNNNCKFQLVREPGLHDFCCF